MPVLTSKQNEMFVTECSAGIKSMAPPINLEDGKNHRDSIDQNAIDQMRAIAGLCNAEEFDAATVNAPLSERKINGDATDQAVLRFSEGLGSVAELRLLWRKTFEMAFNSKNKFMIRTFSLAETRGLETTLPLQEASMFDTEDMLVYISLPNDHLLTRT